MVNTIMKIAFVVLMFAEAGAIIYLVRTWRKAWRDRDEN